jgi:subtilisin family serine protease
MTRPIRVGIVDSGVRRDHPHVGGIAGGITVEADSYRDDFVDCLGHGTAIAALIHALAPAAELLVVRVFDRALTTSVLRVIRAIDWCLQNDIQIINLSLGTTNPDYRGAFAAAVERVKGGGAALVSAFEMNGSPVLPGCMPGVVAVRTDTDCPREEYRCLDQNGRLLFGASPYPLTIPGVPRSRNLNGVSFAVAHISGHLARHGLRRTSHVDWEQMLADGVSAHSSA